MSPWPSPPPPPRTVRLGHRAAPAPAAHLLPLALLGRQRVQDAQLHHLRAQAWGQGSRVLSPPCGAGATVDGREAWRGRSRAGRVGGSPSPGSVQWDHRAGLSLPDPVPASLLSMDTCPGWALHPLGREGGGGRSREKGPEAPEQGRGGEGRATWESWGCLGQVSQEVGGDPAPAGAPPSSLLSGLWPPGCPSGVWLTAMAHPSEQAGLCLCLRAPRL